MEFGRWWDWKLSNGWTIGRAGRTTENLTNSHNYYHSYHHRDQFQELEMKDKIMSGRLSKATCSDFTLIKYWQYVCIMSAVTVYIWSGSVNFHPYVQHDALSNNAAGAHSGLPQCSIVYLRISSRVQLGLTSIVIEFWESINFSEMVALASPWSLLPWIVPLVGANLDRSSGSAGSSSWEGVAWVDGGGVALRLVVVLVFESCLWFCSAVVRVWA